ncbi:hypothetical protein PQS31_06135 [Luteimonas sp BLCC-B24]|uniref:hypothetical protein n=1 Tax=Luteimonas sp. BLCC-B24 TaxID=3025317 RepID=UPI00234E20C8|nr:hypothetical protein [Luteimonas sp. BLCC-B24]MDC7806402.1 hypothetical protein [Luteimonas sp. BLCC-B24]
MNLSLTKRQVRDALGQNTDASVARFFEISTAAVAQWELDRPIPARRVLQAVVKRPDLFGAIAEPAANDDVGPAKEDGDRCAGTGADVEGAQGAESDVHAATCSGAEESSSTMIAVRDQGAGQ